MPLRELEPAAEARLSIRSAAADRSVRAITRNFTDCNAAVAWLNAGENAGDASPQYHPTPGPIRHTSQGGQFSVSVDLTWAYHPSSTADMIIPSWPNMTDAERAAVGSYRVGDPGPRGDALRHHRQHHQGARRAR